MEIISIKEDQKKNCPRLYISKREKKINVERLFVILLRFGTIKKPVKSDARNVIFLVGFENGSS